MRREGAPQETAGERARPSPRPRFTLVSPHRPAELRQRVNAHVRSSPRLRGIALDHRIELSVGGDESHFWSPQLVVAVSEGEGGSRLDARFGPDPYVWAMYVFAYGTLVVLTFFAAMFGIGQWLAGQSPVALFVAPAAAVLAGLVYGASFVGQGLGSEQMYFLRATLTSVADASED